jgi:hypothetical protein
MHCSDVWDYVDRWLKKEQYNMTIDDIKDQTTMYLDIIGVRKINRKYYQPIEIILPELQAMYDLDQAQRELDRNDGNEVRYVEPK